MDKNIFKKIARWGKPVGIITIIAGAINAIFGLFLFVVGALPGIFTIIMGYLMYQSGVKASLYLANDEDDDESVEGILQDYAKFLKIQGILLILGLVLILPLTIALSALPFFAIN